MNLIHKTKYKNIFLTLIMSLFLCALIFAFSHLIFGLGKTFSFIFSLALGVLNFIIIGRKIIVRHLIGNDYHIIVEYLLRPNFKKHYSNSEIENIIFRTIDYKRYGKLEKGMLMFKNKKNYHNGLLTFNLNDEPKWFWSNFKYPNRMKNSR